MNLVGPVGNSLRNDAEAVASLPDSALALAAYHLFRCQGLSIADAFGWATLEYICWMERN